jgi:DNA-binding CsgD family transcriptional regulator
MYQADGVFHASHQVSVRGIRERLTVILPLMYLCGLVFAIDVIGETAALVSGPRDLLLGFHVVSEGVATVLLAVASYLVFCEMGRLEHRADDEHRKLLQLRGEFDDLLRNKFTSWRLTKSETDVALLTVRGMNICDIALSRKRSEGTIKSQLSTIFHKAGVASRTELLSLVIDELLDHSAKR